jgi:hypothetical protein
MFTANSKHIYLSHGGQKYAFEPANAKNKTMYMATDAAIIFPYL